MKIIYAILLFCCITNAHASAIRMYGKEKYGFDQPKYNELANTEDEKEAGRIFALADSENFPISSIEQGSVFNKVFSDLFELEGIKIILRYDNKNYADSLIDFERGVLRNIDARFGVYYQDMPYSRNEYVYPAFFENKIHIITSAKTKLSLNGKAELKNYKGVYVSSDKLPDYIFKEFNSLGMQKTESWEKAYEQLLTGNADYVAASYYPSLLSSYKLGIRDYVTYSKNPVWKTSMFLRVTPKVMKSRLVAKIKSYLKSPHYKKVRDEAFEELVEIYKRNTAGVVPPTFANTDKETSSADMNK